MVARVQRMSDMTLDIAGNRKAIKFDKGVLLKRLLWSLAKPLFRFSPRRFFAWRVFLLRLFGASIGREVHFYNSVQVFAPWNLTVGDWSAIGESSLIYSVGKISIGNRATISQRAHICAGTHDYTKPDLPLITPPIIISDQTWISADAFIGPGVTVHEGAVVGARAVVFVDVPAWTVVAGNPARAIKKRELTED